MDKREMKKQVKNWIIRDFNMNPYGGHYHPRGGGVLEKQQSRFIMSVLKQTPEEISEATRQRLQEVILEILAET